MTIYHTKLNKYYIVFKFCPTKTESQMKQAHFFQSGTFATLSWFAEGAHSERQTAPPFLRRRVSPTSARDYDARQLIIQGIRIALHCTNLSNLERSTP